jgi:trans-L-3-hydroxyproline dehydratase
MPSSEASFMQVIQTVDMHTGGEPLRIITAGYPVIPSGTILEKRSYVRDHLDHLRKILMFEPRGHDAMYGALLVEPDLAGADLAVLFMHNEGYSTMCGHAIIALGRYAVDQSMVPWVKEPFTKVNIECPCGMVEASVAVENGQGGAVSFESVPAFLFAGEQTVDLPGYGRITFDIAYGGAFYAIADCRQFGLEIGRDSVRSLADAGTALTERVKSEFPLSHPRHRDLAFLYGTILTDGGVGGKQPTKNVCVFANAQVDRSPTGSGVTARLAAMHAKGLIGEGQSRTFESIVGSRFAGAVVRTTQDGPYPAITARIAGRAYYCGRAEMIVESDDALGRGFLVR